MPFEDFELFRLFLSKIKNNDLVTDQFISEWNTFYKISLSNIHFQDYYYRMLGIEREKYRFDYRVDSDHVDLILTDGSIKGT